LTAVALPSDRVPATREAARLFEAYSEQLLGYCLGRLGSRSEAEDAVQTTFLYAFRALRRGVVPECESAWLTTIARNACHSQRRTLSRRGPLSTDVDLDTVALARPDGDEDSVLLGLKEALASIPERQRQALLLREWQGLAPREIASRLGMSGPATHALLGRARKSLAQALTLPVRPVAGIAWLFVEIRSYVKAFFTGVSAKAAVAGVAIVGVGAGGVAAERSLADPSTPAAPAAVVDTPRVEMRATPPIVGTRTARVLAAPRERVENVERSSTRVAGTASDRGKITRVLVPTSPTRSGDPAGEPRTRDEQPPAAPDALADLPVKPPILRKAELPPVVVPPVDLPPIDLAPLPPIDLPPVELPPVELPLLP
jgi:RNA polymerase sigma-70 factor, ECF subfamily